MKFLSLFLLSFITTLAYAKPLHLQGTIVDAQTGKPVPSATVSVPAKNFFYPANNEGKFTTDENNLAGTDTLTISCIGYQSAKIVIKDILTNATIRLSPMVNMLKEVTIGYKVIKTGSRLKSGSGGASYLPGMEQAMFMAGSAGHNGTIQSVGFFLGKGGNVFVKGRGDITAPFRIRIYAADSSGMPGKELTKDIIIVSAKKNNQWFDVDVSGYRVEAPETGFCVAFVLLDAAYYKINSSYQYNAGYIHSSEDISTPHIAISPNEFKEPLTYTLIRTRSGLIKWRKDTSGFNCLMRASIAGN